MISSSACVTSPPPCSLIILLPTYTTEVRSGLPRMFVESTHRWKQRQGLDFSAYRFPGEGSSEGKGVGVVQVRGGGGGGRRGVGAVTETRKKVTGQNRGLFPLYPPDGSPLAPNPLPPFVSCTCPFTVRCDVTAMTSRAV